MCVCVCTAHVNVTEYNNEITTTKLSYLLRLRETSGGKQV